MAEENGRFCVVCGKPLTGKQELYCSMSCIMRAWKNKLRGGQPDAERIKICRHCGKEFVAADKRRKYCSAECVKEQHKAQHREQMSHYRRKKRAEKKEPVRICTWCGKEFDGRSANAKYCCKECGYLARAAREHEKYIEMQQTPEGRDREVVRRQKRERTLTKKICAICGKEFEAKNPVTKYCGDECRKKAATIHAIQWRERIMETPEGREKFRERTKRYTETQKAKPKYDEKYEEKLEQYKERYKLKKENGWTRKCAYCKKWFAGEKGVKYCSDECREAAEKGKDALMAGARTSDRICVICGKPLPAGRRQFCSDECRATAAKQKRRKNRNKD